MFPTLLLIVLTAFLLLQLAPGDMIQALAGETGGASVEYMAHLRQSFGMDKSIPTQFAIYLEQVLQGNLGFSFRNNMPVNALIASRIAPTLLLSIASLLIATLIGIAVGAWAATRQNGWIDRLSSLVMLLIYATPTFLVGIGLILTFSVALPWLPIGGFSDPRSAEGWMTQVGSIARHLLLPALTLGLFQAAIYARFTRTAMLEVQYQDFVRTAHAKGLSGARIIWWHVLRNAWLPIVTLIGMQMGSLLSGAILVETVFAWPGIGRLAFEAVQQRDYNLLAGLILCSGSLVVLINLAVDLLYAVLDPRVRVR